MKVVKVTVFRQAKETKFRYCQEKEIYKTGKIICRLDQWPFRYGSHDTNTAVIQ